MTEQKIIEKFQEIQKAQPALGDFPSLAKALRGSGISDGIVERLYNNLIDPNEVVRSEKASNLFYLIQITKKSSKEAL